MKRELSVQLTALLAGLLLIGGAIVDVATAAQPVVVDWSQPGFDARHSSYNAYESVLNETNVARLAVLWSANAGAGATLRAVTRTRVYASAANRLMTFCVRDGLPGWAKTLPGNVVSVAIWNGRVYVAANRFEGGAPVATLHALRGGDGAQLWMKTLSSAEFSHIVTSKHGLFTTATLRKVGEPYACRAVVTARNPVTGQSLWSRLGTPPIPEAPFCYAAGPLSEHDGVIYARYPCTDRSCLSILEAFNASTRAALWSIEDARPTAVPVVASTAVYLGGHWSYVGSVSRYGAADGVRTWNLLPGPYDFTTVSQPAAARGKLLFSWAGSDSGITELKALDGATGTDAWSQPGSFGKPTVANALVYVAGSELAAFRLADGAPVWSQPAPDGDGFYGSETIVVNGRVYGMSSSGKVYAFGLKPLSP